jgi:hypothetical protein
VCSFGARATANRSAPVPRRNEDATGHTVSPARGPTTDRESRRRGGGARRNTARRCTGRGASRIPDRRRSARSPRADHAPRPIWRRSAGTGPPVRNQRERPELSPPGRSGIASWPSSRLAFRFTESVGTDPGPSPTSHHAALPGDGPPPSRSGDPGLLFTVTRVTPRVFGPKASSGLHRKASSSGSERLARPSPCCNGYQATLTAAKPEPARPSLVPGVGRPLPGPNRPR